MNDKVYIHEFIDIIGANRARYMHHMTANWCPVAPRTQPAVLRGVGHGRLDRPLARGREPVGARRWDGPGGQLQPRACATTRCRIRRWPSGVARAADLRRGGVDRIVVPEPWTDPSRAHGPEGERRGVRPRAVPGPAGSLPGRARAPRLHGPPGGRRAGRDLCGRRRGGHGQRGRVPGHLGAAQLGPPGPATSRRGPGRGAASVGRVVGRGRSGTAAPCWWMHRWLRCASGRQPLASDRRPLDEL